MAAFLVADVVAGGRAFDLAGAVARAAGGQQVSEDGTADPAGVVWVCGARDAAGFGVAEAGQGSGGAQQVAAMAAQAVQAALAGNEPEGMCASGPLVRSAKTCSTIAWPRWAFSASSISKGLLVNTA